mgnify:CR=1 FL=1
MFFLPQSVARLPPIGISYLELCYLVRDFFCKILLFQTAKRDDRFFTAYGHVVDYICLLCITPVISLERAA